jgi:hypothetical protein
MSWQPPPPPNRGQQQPPQPGQPPAPAKQTFYDLLQVAQNAHPTIIRYAYRFLAGIYHPDNTETGSSEAFRQISEAFKTLSDGGRRAAYDAHLGPLLKKEADTLADLGAAKGQKSLQFEKTSLSYNEIELRLAILQLLLQSRKKRVQTGGCSARTLMDVLGVDMAEMEFALWYLREKGYAERQEAQFMITVNGVDYIVDSLTKTQIIDEGPKTVPNYPEGGSTPNLPTITR